MQIFAKSLMSVIKIAEIILLHKILNLKIVFRRFRPY